MTPAQVLSRIEDIGLVMVVRSRSADDALAAIAAARAGGVRSVEVTFTTPDTAATIARARATYDDLLIGAGTVLSLADAEDAVAAGAQYVVSPGLDGSLLDWATEHETLALPGVLTPSEVLAAREFGALAVKLFPAQSVGPAHLRALLAPYPELRVVPTGGVSILNAADWLRAGAVAVGIGGALSPDVTVTPDVAVAITSAATQSVAAVRTFRNRANEESL